MSKSQNVGSYIYVKCSLEPKRSSKYGRIKERLWIQQGGKCYWCKKDCKFTGNGGTPDEFTVDHVIPISHKGTDHWMNMVGSCHTCNNKRNRVWEKLRIVDLNKKEVEDTYPLLEINFA